MLLLRTLLAAACLAALTSTSVSSPQPLGQATQQLQATQSQIGEFRVALVQAMHPQPPQPPFSHRTSANAFGPLWFQVSDSDLIDSQSYARFLVLSDLKAKSIAANDAHAARVRAARRAGRVYQHIDDDDDVVMDYSQQTEYHELENRLHEMRVYASGSSHRDGMSKDDPRDNSRCVEKFRHTMAQQGDYSWTDEAVQKYIHHHQLDVSDPYHENPSTHGTRAECEQVLQYALAVRAGHITHPQRPENDREGFQHLREVSAHREFHPANRGMRLNEDQLKFRQDEQAVWHQYLRDVKRLDKILRARRESVSLPQAHANANAQRHAQEFAQQELNMRNNARRLIDNLGQRSQSRAGA